MGSDWNDWVVDWVIDRGVSFYSRRYRRRRHPRRPPRIDRALAPTLAPTYPFQIAGLPTMIFIGTDDSKPALRSEGLMTAETIKGILRKDLLVGAAAAPEAQAQ